MKIVQFLPAMFFSVFVGCKSDHTTSSVVIPAQRSQVALSSSISTTNIYYMIDQGPGCAVFFKQSDIELMNALLGTSSKGTKVVVVDGHFPPPSQMPTSPSISVDQFSNRDMSLLDDTGTK
jgi:hypothetical protein